MSTTLTKPLHRFSARHAARLPLMVTATLLVAMFSIGSVQYEGFFSAQVLLNVLIDNSFLLVVAIGMTFVVLTGGIDLSVGSMVALSTMLTAWLVEQNGLPLALAVPVVLLVGAGAAPSWAG